MRYLSLLLLALGCSSGAAPAQDEGFVPMFNGKDLTGWVRVNCAPETFRAEGGEIITTGKPTGVMRSERMYENYVIELDWMHLKPRGNSGLFVHSGAFPAKGTPFTKGHEIQVLDGDSTDGTWTGHGDVFSIHGATFEPDRPHPKGWMRCLPSEKRANPVGQWNHYRVTVNDGTIKLEVNGKEVSGGRKCNPRKGYICLESEGSECHFKNIRIKELPSTNPPAEEINETDQGFTSLYTGLDFRGWKTDTESEWKVQDWTFEGTGKGEQLLSDKGYRNFVLTVDWRTRSNGKVGLNAHGKAGYTSQSEIKPQVWHRTQVTHKDYQTTFVEDGKAVLTESAAQQWNGPIGLRAVGGPVQFANVFIKELP